MSVPWKNSPVKAGFPSDRRLDLQGHVGTSGSSGTTPSSQRGDKGSDKKNNTHSNERDNRPLSAVSTAVSSASSGKGDPVHATAHDQLQVAPQRLFTSTPMFSRPEGVKDSIFYGDGRASPHTSMSAMFDAITPTSNHSSSQPSSGHSSLQGSTQSSSKKEIKRSSPNGSILYKGESGGGRLREVPLREDRAVYSMLLSSACSSMFDDDEDHDGSINGPDSPRLHVPAQVSFFLDDKSVSKSSPSTAGDSRHSSPEGSYSMSQSPSSKMAELGHRSIYNDEHLYNNTDINRKGHNGAASDQDLDESGYLQAHSSGAAAGVLSTASAPHNNNLSSDTRQESCVEKPVYDTFNYTYPSSSLSHSASQGAYPLDAGMLPAQEPRSADIPAASSSVKMHIDPGTNARVMETRPIDSDFVSRDYNPAPLSAWPSKSSQITGVLAQPPNSTMDDDLIERFAGDSELAPLAQYLAYVDKACALTRSLGGTVVHDRALFDAKASERKALEVFVDQLVKARSADILVHEIYRRVSQYSFLCYLQCSTSQSSFMLLGICGC
jgi:hypothetical protein